MLRTKGTIASGGFEVTKEALDHSNSI